MPDTFTTLWNRLLLRCPDIGPALSQDLVRDAFNQLAERRPWSWLRRMGAYAPATFTVPGTVTTIQGSATVTGLGTAFTTLLTGKQIRIGGAGCKTYTIALVPSATSLTLDQPWAGAAVTGAAYELLDCYVTPPSDFNYWYSVVNASANYRLWTNTTGAEIDRCDPQRTQSGNAFCLAFLDYQNAYQGTVEAVVQAFGAGPSPVSMSTLGYSYPANSVYTIEITTTGIVGVSDFRWKQDAGAWTGGVVTDPGALDLSNGVQVYFPAGNYIDGDIFVIPCRAGTVTGLPRYEAWPRAASQIYPYTYIARAPELSDDTPQLPIYVRGDVLIEMALRNCAMIPGFSEGRKNSYFNIPVANMHKAESEKMIMELEKKDDEVAPEDLAWQSMQNAPAPWADGSWQQTHAPIY